MNKMAKKAAQLELERMLSDESHRSQHVPVNHCQLDDQSDDGEDVTEDIASIWYRNFSKIFWYSVTEEPFEHLRSTPDSELGDILTTSVYKVNPSFHYLKGNEIQIPIPAVSVKEPLKDKVRIAWTHNLGINYIQKTWIKIGDVKINEFDPGWLDDYMNWATEPSLSKQLNYSIGNVPELTTWNTSLNRKTCIFSIPFFYTYSGGSALPLFLLDSQTQVTQSLSYFSDPIKYLLRIEGTKDNGKTWRPIGRKTNYRKLISFNKFQDPVFSGDYGTITDEEKDDVIAEGAVAIPVHDVSIFKGSNDIGYGRDDPIKLHTSDPVIGMFWKALNVEAENNNYRTNYTTDANDVNLGVSPITSSEFKYGKVTRFRKSSEQMKSINMRKNFSNIPNLNGYHAYPFSQNPFHVRGHTGVIFSNDPEHILTCTFTNPSQTNRLNEIQEDNDQDLSDILDSLMSENENGDHYFGSSSSEAASSSGSSEASVGHKIHSGHNDKAIFRTEVRVLVWRELQFRYDKEKAGFDFDYI